MPAEHRPSPDERARWAASGLLALTGEPDGPGLVAPPALVRHVEALATAASPAAPAAAPASPPAVRAMRATPDAAAVGGRRGAAAGVPAGGGAGGGLAVLAERAAIAGLGRRGATSCGGATRLLAAADGWLALSLARPADVEVLAAWLEADLPLPDPGEPERPDDAWAVVGGAVAAAVARRPAADLASRARMLSLPASRLGEAAAGGPAARAGVVARRLADRPAAGGAPLVVDLSALWAGPLCARLLGAAGARVVKVESMARPDGARRGPPAFYDRLHAGHRSVALDLGGPDGRVALRRLVAAADVVIEASRPRALAQFGVDAEEAVRVGGVRAWVSITGYGRADDGVAFGDDAAVAGGLVAWGAGGRPRFVADAVADPLAGLAAAGAARAALRAGGGWLLDVSMAHVAAEAAAACGPPGTPWPPGAPGEATPPPTPPPAPPAASLGADTAAVLAELAASGERGRTSGPTGRDARAERATP